MASSGSRWATTAEDAAIIERRKQEKLEKKRLKEEKAQQAAEEAAAAREASLQAQQEQLSDERPAKRRRTSASPPPAPEPEAHLLHFPQTTFGPSSSVDGYEILNAVEEGSYGKVSRARCRRTGDMVALKKLKINHTADEGFPITGLREIQTLTACSHPNIITLKEVVVGTSLTE